MLALVCRVGGERLVLDARQVLEVAPRVRLQAVDGGPAWLAGAFAYRGQVTPVLDLAQLITGKPCPARWSSRIIVVRLAEAENRLAGLLVEQVTPGELPTGPAAAGQAGTPSPWGALLLDEEGMYQLVDLGKLLSPERRRAAFLLAGPGEPGERH